MWKVVSWNVNSVNARLERLLAFLARESPDVVLLQELKCEEPKYPLQALTAAGYHSAMYGQKTYNGVAILAKTPITQVTRGFGDGELEEARFIAGVVDGVRVASVYIPNGQAVGAEKYHYKIRFFDRLGIHLDQTLPKPGPFVLGGDFNVAPEDRDVHDPTFWEGQILFSEPEKTALNNLTLRLGLHDTFRKHHSEAGHYSWWDYRMLGFQKNKGLRIDFLYASPSMLELCTAAQIDRDERNGPLPSDHAPVIAEFDLKKA